MCGLLPSSSQLPPQRVLSYPTLQMERPRLQAVRLLPQGPQPASGGSRICFHVEVNLLTWKDVYNILLNEKAAHRTTEYNLGEYH